MPGEYLREQNRSKLGRPGVGVMADAVIASWDGHDYLARFFWIYASGLRNPETPHVVEVSYETDGPKSFDDVVVRYTPGQTERLSFRVETAHHF